MKLIWATLSIFYVLTRCVRKMLATLGKFSLHQKMCNYFFFQFSRLENVINGGIQNKWWKFPSLFKAKSWKLMLKPTIHKLNRFFLSNVKIFFPFMRFILLIPRGKQKPEHIKRKCLFKFEFKLFQQVAA